MFLNRKPYVTFTVLCSTEKTKPKTTKKPHTKKQTNNKKTPPNQNPKLNKDSNTQDCTKQWGIIRLWI